MEIPPQNNSYACCIHNRSIGGVFATKTNPLSKWHYGST